MKCNHGDEKLFDVIYTEDHAFFNKNKIFVSFFTTKDDIAIEKY